MDKIIDFLLRLLVGLVLLVQSIFVSIGKFIVPSAWRSKSVAGEITVVTGSGSGIGRLMAINLAKQGAKLVLIDVDAASNEKTCEAILTNGGFAKTFTCDLSSRDEIYQTANQIKKTVGNPQILVNNAGIVTGKKFLESSDQAVEKTFQVNTMAHFWLAKAFLPHMIAENHGHLVTIASVAGYFGTSGLSDYCASKFAAVGFDESIRDELALTEKYGVQTTLVCPYYINTGMFDGIENPLIPLLEPDYVADKIVEAILTNQKILFMPRLFYFLYAFKGMLSAEVARYFSLKLLKTSQLMDSFIGRQKKTK